MDKIRFAGIHLIISACVVTGFLLFAYFIWYAKIFVGISGALAPVKVLIIVDILLGPLLTFLIYKKGKEKLKTDLAVIVLLQVMAFSYGVYTLYLGKPALVVMKKDSFEIIIQKQVDSELKQTLSNQLGCFSGPTYALVDPNKINVFQSAFVQQAFLLSLSLSDLQQLDKNMPLERVLMLLNMTKKELINKLDSENLDDFNFYLMNDADSYAVMVVDNNSQPTKIIQTVQDNQSLVGPG